MILKNNGYDVAILHEKNDYIKPGAWLGDEYDTLQHHSIEDNTLKVGPQDYVIIPEIYGSLLEQIQQLPVDRVLLIQCFEYLLDSFAPGKSWLDYGVGDCITTSKTLSEMVGELVGGVDVNYINPAIPDFFSPSDKPTKPLIAIHCRDQRKTAKIIKSFYLKYPIYRFISFKDMHGMGVKDFANNLKECALAIWVDDDSSFGTFPIEAMKCNVPIIGKIPTIIPEWITDDNGIWVYDENQISDLIYNFMKTWMEDKTPENFLNISNTVKNLYTEENFNTATIAVYESLFDKKIKKLNTIKENLQKNLKTNEN
jgi:hypothetical protein